MAELYAMELRERVVQCRAAGEGSYRTIAARFAIGRRQSSGGSGSRGSKDICWGRKEVAPRPQPRRCHGRFTPSLEAV